MRSIRFCGVVYNIIIVHRTLGAVIRLSALINNNNNKTQSSQFVVVERRHDSTYYSPFLWAIYRVDVLARRLRAHSISHLHHRRNPDRPATTNSSRRRQATVGPSQPPFGGQLTVSCVIIHISYYHNIAAL